MRDAADGAGHGWLALGPRAARRGRGGHRQDHPGPGLGGPIAPGRGCRRRRLRVDVSGALPFGPVLEAVYQLAGPDIALPDTSAPNALGLLVNAFADLTDRAPAVLVLEDLHWADQYTVDFARAFVRSTRARALLVITYRSDDAAPTLRDALVDLRRADGVTLLPLGPLPPAALGDLATRRLGRDLDDDAMTALFRRSEGNPLYAEEILAAETPGIPASSATC